MCTVMKPYRKNDLNTNNRHQKDLYPANSPQNLSTPDQQHNSRPTQNLLPSLGGSDETNIQGLMTGSDQPREMLHNPQSLDMNQQVFKSKTSTALEQPSENKYIISKLRPTAPQISSRAAELKAQLLARRATSVNSQNRKSSPNLAMSGGRQELPPRSSPKIKFTRENFTTKNGKKELNLNELILQYSVSEPGADSKSNMEEPIRLPFKSDIPDIEPNNQEPEETNGPSEKTNMTGQESFTISKISDDLQSVQKDAHVDIESKEAASDASEGEIFEDADMDTHEPISPKLIDRRDSTNIVRSGENLSQYQHGDTSIEIPQYRILEKGSLPQNSHAAPSPQSIPKIQSNKPTEIERRRQKQPYSIERSYEKSPTQSSAKNELCHASRSGDNNISEVKLVSARAENSRERPIFPTIIDEIIPHNADLREWLEITGFHDAHYRNKILARRRAIAALDAQKERLLAEIESEVRGGVPTAIRAQLQPPSMLPPPTPSFKVERRNGTIAPNVATSPVIDDYYRVSVNKRFYSQGQDSLMNSGPNKVARIHEKNYGPKVREEEIFDDCHSRLGGYSITNPYSFNRHDDIVPRYRLMSSSSYRNYNSSQDCLVDEQMVPTRFAVYENDFYDEEDTSEIGSRPFEVRGNYRGRSFDPNHRGRGRGRGRGDLQDLRGSPVPSLGAPSGSKISNGKPNRNFTSWSRGPRGGIP